MQNSKKKANIRSKLCKKSVPRIYSKGLTQLFLMFVTKTFEANFFGNFMLNF